MEDPATLARAIRHAWLTDLIHQIHQQSRGTYGAPRVHAELEFGYEVRVGHNAVALLMRRAGLQGLAEAEAPGGGESDRWIHQRTWSIATSSATNPIA